MKNWFLRNWHWLFFLVVIAGFAAGLVDFTFSATTVIATVFGGLGTVSVGVLMYYAEKQKRQTN